MCKKRIIIGLTGKSGAGKGTVAEYLKKKGFKYHSCSDILREELKKRGIKENIDNLIALGNELRHTFGPGILGKKILEKIIENGEQKAIADSLRHPKEIEELKKDDHFILIALDAPLKLRYERIKARGRAGDNITFKKFKEQEEYQMEGKGPQAQLLKCLKMADYKIVNDESIAKLYQKVETVLKTIYKNWLPFR